MAEQALLTHPWPGNVRELENACKRAAVLNPKGVIEAENFALNSINSNLQSPQKIIKEPEKADLELAMRQYEGVIAKVARHFGLSRQALYRRLQKFEIEY